MFNYKGAGVVFLRNKVKSINKEEELLKSLTEEEKNVFRTTMDVSWVPMQMVDKFFSLSAQLCYPGLPKNEQLQRIGFELAKSSVNFIYAMAFKVMSTAGLIEKAAKLWRQYHSGGTGSVRDVKPDGSVFVIQGYSDLPEDFAEALCGYIAGFATMTGATNCSVVKSKQKDEWALHLKWTPK